MAFTLTDYKNKYLKPGVLIVIIIVVLLITVIVLALKPKPKGPPQPQTELPETVSKLSEKQVLPPKNQRDSPTDKVKTIKLEILKSKIGEDTGTIILFKSETYIIEYVPTPDIFFVTILKVPIDQNKIAAEGWFRDFGLTESEICSLPVRFSLGITDVNFKEPFDPFPTACN
ncbi:hypothetical protein A2W45_00370 [Candidatus Curtissbacteria bacterium RIFCSPHIGHO2_12_41_11]|uniref:Uncharacterized protein n=2 Tax=Candidatus Curtissiibacteriota TaxID=1752717 RepID=A0A1F5H6R2_9BACT|nr:MAG: hypothetical protein A3D07_03340 [Candidatus Curtissbacteria bacterium RIFCSPHIGHO2_02_FULL_42_15]OGD99768.1 MAG: hypothetical protein A2W45_00370 [Candidatus Curtissbacteria bacterium RIFCSPHIGHO2_12_41_11]